MCEIQVLPVYSEGFQDASCSIILRSLVLFCLADLEVETLLL